MNDGVPRRSRSPEKLDAPPVDAARVERRLEALASFAEPDMPPLTRRAFSEAHARARTWLAEEFGSANLEPSVDAAGNLLGRSSRSRAPMILLGSHDDTVVGGGRFDGTTGVVAALEVAHLLAEHAVDLNHPHAVVSFLAEEFNDFGLSRIRSRAMAGRLDPEHLSADDGEGRTLADAIRDVGGTPERLRGGPLLTPDEVAVFLELHIEQGPVLEHHGIPVGIVEGIVGIRRRQIEVRGRQDHAGTTPMSLRRDALVGAANLVTFVRETASDHDLVATIGRLTPYPNSASVVPGRVHLTIEARSMSDGDLDAFFAGVDERVGLLVRRDGLELRTLRETRTSPAACSPFVREAIGEAAASCGFRSMEIASGAGHDAAAMTHICPTGMIFVPSIGGRSHTREEDTNLEDIVAGTQTLLAAVLRLDQKLVAS